MYELDTKVDESLFSIQTVSLMFDVASKHRKQNNGLETKKERRTDLQLPKESN